MSKDRRRRPKAPVPPLRIHVVIMTYDRPEGCRRLLGDVLMSQGDHEVSLTVYDDASHSDYAEVHDVLRRHGWKMEIAPQNRGKKRFWRSMGNMHADQRDVEADFWVVLPDDVRLCRNFFDRMITIWNNLDDPKKISIFLQNDLRESCWNRDPYVELEEVTKTGWVDGPLLVCQRRFFEALGYDCPSPGKYWDRNPRRSSGVGHMISTKLNEWNAGLGLYRTNRSHVVHVGCKLSKMNPVERVENPLRAHHFVDGELISGAMIRGDRVVACIASMPDRDWALAKTVESLRDQVDEIVVYLNDYDEIPAFLRQPRITVLRSQDNGDHGDASKFFAVSSMYANGKAYILTCDDDIVYPPDYARLAVEGVEKYGRKAFVGFHGATLPRSPQNYYRSRTPFHWSRELAEDTPVHVLGTGLLAFHTNLAKKHKLSMDVMRHRNMADLNLGVWAKTHKIPLVCLSHRALFIENLEIEGIYHQACAHDPVQTMAIQEVAPWIPPTLPPEIVLSDSD